MCLCLYPPWRHRQSYRGLYISYETPPVRLPVLGDILSKIRVSKFLFNCLKLHGASSAPIYICRS